MMDSDGHPGIIRHGEVMKRLRQAGTQSEAAGGKHIKDIFLAPPVFELVLQGVTQQVTSDGNQQYAT
ncbi:hypothetical protein DUI87_07486 [Hirundo rustica rustica]|uniref:Uncharacterized protein n=1 Tax=Hirundo rustica rustica TaxID=333673 RepID=A0A3M0L7U6_HIRRU|nr:hypothetical protein DUI87_07486 [Hirundo rustica rustica]